MVAIIPRTHRAIVTTALLFFATAGCDSSSDGDADPGPLPPTEPAVGTVETFTELGSVSEGLAFGVDEQGDDVLYVSTPSAGLVRIWPDGAYEDFSSVPGPVGIARRADDSLLVCGKSIDEQESVIWLVAPDGSKSELVKGTTEALSLTNYVAVAPDDRIVFTDSAAGGVYVAEPDGTNLTAITTTISYANGLAFAPDGETLYVASWDTTTLYAIPREPVDGTYGEPTVLAEGVAAVDGLVVTTNGDLLLVTSGDGIVRLSSNGSTAEAAPSSAFAMPANAAFGQGPFDPEWLYVTNIFGTAVQRLRFDETGVVLPVR